MWCVGHAKYYHSQSWQVTKRHEKRYTIVQWHKKWKLKLMAGKEIVSFFSSILSQFPFPHSCGFSILYEYNLLWPLKKDLQSRYYLSRNLLLLQLHCELIILLSMIHNHSIGPNPGWMDSFQSTSTTLLGHFYEVVERGKKDKLSERI